MDKVLVEYNSSNGIFFQHRVLDREYSVKKTSHAYYEFVYLVKGKMELYTEGQTKEIGAGELVMINANVAHAQKLLGGEMTELMVVGVLPGVLPSIVKLGFIDVVSENPILFHSLPKDIVAECKFFNCFKKICSLSKKLDLPYKDLYISAEMTRFVAILSDAVDKLMRYNNDSENNSNQSVIITKCLNYLSLNLAKKITIDEIAENLCCSKSYLQHVFKKEMHCSISEYLNSQKMSTARMLLGENLTPSEVADRLGYEYYSTFSAKFKKFYGFAPRKAGTGKIVLNVDFDKEKKDN